MQAVKVEGFLLFKELNGNIAVRFHACQRKIFLHTEFFVIPENSVVSESKAVSVNVTKKRVVILVKLRVTLSRHAGVPHDDMDAVRDVDFHLPSGNRTLVDTQAVVEIVRNTGRIRAAHLTFASQRIQYFVLCVSAQALFEIN